MREAAAEQIDKISIAAREGYAKHGAGFVWLQFMFHGGQWELVIKYFPLARALELGMRSDTMANIKSIAKQCDPTKHAAVLIFKGDKIETMGLMGLTGED